MMKNFGYRVSETKKSKLHSKSSHEHTKTIFYLEMDLEIWIEK